MKKFDKIIIALISFIILDIGILAGSLLNFAYDFTDDIKDTISYDSSYSPVYADKAIHVGTDQHDYTPEAMDGIISQVPSKIVNQFFKDGYSLKYMDKDSYREDKKEDWSCGYFSLGDKKIVVLNPSRRSESVTDTTCHEFGHYFDFVILGNISSQEKWQEICKKESAGSIVNKKKDKEYNADEAEYMSNYGDYDTYFEIPSEFFAQEFSIYCRRNSYPDEYNAEIKHCPEAQAYIAELVNSL